MANEAIMRLSRNERRLILAKEERLRKSGNWLAWTVRSFSVGTVSPDPRGWAFHFTMAHSNDVFSVLDRTLPNGVRHLAVTSLSEVRPTWREMQRIKDEIAGPEATAVEVYPPHDEIVDEANVFHIWVMPGPLAFSLARAS